MEHSIICYASFDGGETWIRPERDVEDGTYRLNVGCDNCNVLFRVVCDGIEDSDSFIVKCYGDDGFTMTKERCRVSIGITENKTNETREYKAVFTHANDAEVGQTIIIAQEEQEYGLFVKDGYGTECDEITFNSVLNGTYEEKELKITVIGGDEKMRILSIYSYNEDKSSQKRFDGGFMYIIGGNNTLIIRNYGRTLMTDGDFYELTICHNSDKTIKKTVAIKYRSPQPSF